MGKKIFINFCVLFFCLVILEIICFNIARNENIKWQSWTLDTDPIISYSLNLTPFNKYYFALQDEMRPPSGLSFSSRPIVLFGGSFARGNGLENNQTLSYKLSESLGRPVYNRGIGGGGIQHFYYQLARKDFYEQIKRTPEYIFFLYLPTHHIHRLYEYTFHLFSRRFYLRYARNKKGDDGKLIQLSSMLPKYINGLYLTKSIYKILAKYNFNKDRRYHEDFEYFLFKEAMNQGKKRYKDSKFVLLCYELDDELEASCKNNQELFERLKNDGFLVLNTKDLIGRNLNLPRDRISDTDDHPTEAVWDLVVPPLSRELGLL